MFVVTLPPSAAKDPTVFARRAKEAGADILEVRGDLTPGVRAFPSPLPLLVSPRGAGRAFCKRLKPTYIDLERDEDVAVGKDVTVIRSHHDHERTPTFSKLQVIVSDLLERGADIVKIATRIGTYQDLATLEILRRECATLGVRHVILGMGPKAHLSRLLSPTRNELTYAFIDDDEAVADGQLPLSLYALTSHCRKPKIFGLLGGEQVVSSLSPLIHNTLFHRHKLDVLYSVFPTDNILEAGVNLTKLGVAGYSVASPWKQDILRYAQKLDPLAEELRSANTLVREREQWVTYSTDADGFAQGYDFIGRNDSVAILGSGGVVPAVITACISLGVKSMTVYARNETALTELRQQFKVETGSLSELVKTKPSVIICALSADVPVVLPLLKRKVQAIDLRYGKETCFLRDARLLGMETHDGLSMLIHQAMKQFELFTGITPSRDDLTVVQSLFARTPQASSFKR